MAMWTGFVPGSGTVGHSPLPFGDVAEEKNVLLHLAPHFLHQGADPIPHRLQHEAEPPCPLTWVAPLQSRAHLVDRDAGEQTLRV